ncbi:MAG: hypothetical protein RI637_12050 [Acidimicrobiia bacterium]|nr:hypothetical protein [Acidimicrobiia bacterium]
MRYHYEDSFLSDDGQYGARYEMSIKTNSNDITDSGFWTANRSEFSESITWSDGSGVYAQRIHSKRSTYNQHGDLTSNRFEGGFDVICLRSGPLASG